MLGRSLAELLAFSRPEEPFLQNKIILLRSSSTSLGGPEQLKKMSSLGNAFGLVTVPDPVSKN